MADFYTRVFGWQANKHGEEMGNYVTVMTTDADENGRPKNPGAINGGLYPERPGMDNHPSLVIGVDDIKQSIEDIKKGGGKVLGDPAMIPGVGLWVSFVDTEGNTMSVLQPQM
jgi:uncharacterized protein